MGRRWKLSDGGVRHPNQIKHENPSEVAAEPAGVEIKTDPDTDEYIITHYFRDRAPFVLRMSAAAFLIFKSALMGHGATNIHSWLIAWLLLS